MLSAEVVINQKAKAFDESFTYLVSDALASQIACGMRVLVPLGNRRVEGYVRNLRPIEDQGSLKMIIDILDREPVINANLFKLADWMAQYYLSPLSSVLALMVPRAQAKAHSDRIILNPHLSHEYWKNLDKDTASFLNSIAHSGGIARDKAMQLLGEDVLNQLCTENILIPVKRYGTKRHRKEGWVYKLVDSAQFDIDKIRRRAPRQAEILELLKMVGPMDCRKLEEEYTMSSIRSLIGQGLIERHKLQPEIKPALFNLSPEQSLVVSAVQQALDGNKYQEFLLHGVTGSGKTEVYINCALSAMEKGLQTIVLVPEIALTEHLISQFAARIPGTAILHSGLPALERYEEWKRISNGEANLVLGTRLAVFAPFNNLGLIIIDEEQESTYKQEETPRYNAREVARFRCQLESAVLLLGSATPSVESYHRTITGSSQILRLPERVEGIPLPEVIAEDMRVNWRQGHMLSISPRLAECIQEALENGQQCILFLNRRGYSPMTICQQCGMIATCPRCAVSLNYHQDVKQYICHYCNYQVEEITVCSHCSSHHLARVGWGTQKVEQDVRQLFPNARIDRLDIDNARRRGYLQKVLASMQHGDTDILIGTQMVAKGLDFPRVSLVGIISADGMLGIPDYRAGERAFQLLVQAAGRSGRSSIPGQVIIQTFQPDHPIIRMAIRQDYHGFFTEEIKLRKYLGYPPFSSILRIEISSKIQNKAQKTADILKQLIDERMDSIEDDMQILGPAPCPIWKLRNRFRLQMVLKADSRGLLQSLGSYLLQYRWDPDVRVVFDMDPGIMM
ncbi:MAG TPA: primosomal protein N' [Syntrophomonadaceae bacterium]|nr:primosomal protein N' [Syntrophomonadaceae bacterium]HQE22531.1 primosomal protein N' [Syntrophomonadaceae bacterium]